MLIGAHVSPAGGPANAVARGVERGCDGDPDLQPEPARVEADGLQRRAGRGLPRGDGGQPRRRAADPRRLPAQRGHDRQGDPRQDARLADRLAARRATRSAPHAVVLHPGSRPGRQGRARRSSARARSSREALAESDALPAAPREHRGHRAARSGARSRSWPTLFEAAGGGDRAWACAWTPATCSPRATTSAPRTGCAGALDECDALVGAERLGSLHLNDSQTPLGSNRDRHADVGEGEIGRRGCAVFLSEPRFAELPCVLETPGPDRQGPTKAEITLTRRLLGQGTNRRR